MSLAVVIPFYKNKEQLHRCLAALATQVDKKDIFIVDDSETSYGFTIAVNDGLKKTLAYTYTVILNQDCYLAPDAINAMVKFMDAHPRCAMAGIKQLSSHNTDEIIHGGTAECFPLGMHYTGFVSKGQCNVSCQVPWVNGACMIVRMQATIDFGLMDVNLKMFYSDSDWGYTARARGWECWYISDAVCVHEKGASNFNLADKESFFTKIFEADQKYFVDKWMNGVLYRTLDEMFNAPSVTK